MPLQRIVNSSTNTPARLGPGVGEPVRSDGDERLVAAAVLAGPLDPRPGASDPSVNEVNVTVRATSERVVRLRSFAVGLAAGSWCDTPHSSSCPCGDDSGRWSNHPSAWPCDCCLSRETGRIHSCRATLDSCTRTDATHRTSRRWRLLAPHRSSRGSPSSSANCIASATSSSPSAVAPTRRSLRPSHTARWARPRPGRHGRLAVARRRRGVRLPGARRRSGVSHGRRW